MKIRSVLSLVIVSCSLLFAEQHNTVRAPANFKYYPIIFDGTKVSRGSEPVTDLKKNRVYFQSPYGDVAYVVVVTDSGPLKLGDGSEITGEWIFKNDKLESNSSDKVFKINLTGTSDFVTDITETPKVIPLSFAPEIKAKRSYRYSYVLENGSTPQFVWSDPKKMAVQETVYTSPNAIIPTGGAENCTT